MSNLSVDALKYTGVPNVDRYLEWYGKGIFAFLLVSIALLGTGRLEFFSVSAWSVSRTTFLSWLLWKLLSAIRYRRWPVNSLSHTIPFSLLLFFIAVTISLLPDFHASGDFRYFFFGCAHAVMVMDLFEDQRRGHWVYLCLALLPGIVTFRDILNDPSVLNLDLTRRLGYPLDHPNTAGYLFSMSIPLALALVVTEKGALRGLAVLSCAAQLVGLVLTYSRGAWLGWAASMIFLAVTWKRWKEASGILVAFVLVFAFAAPLRDRLLTLLKPQADIAINERMEVMGGAIKLGAEHPILGIGYGRGRLKEALRGAFRGTAIENSPIWHAHNVYVELFAETGVLGLGAFLWLLGCTGYLILRRAYSERHASRMILLGLAGSWIAAAITGFGDVPFYHHETRIFFFTILALAFVSDRTRDISGQS
jgi:O-antigen ligase